VGFPSEEAELRFRESSGQTLQLTQARVGDAGSNSPRMRVTPSDEAEKNILDLVTVTKTVSIMSDSPMPGLGTGPAV
jgi:hypothetical protein